MVHCNVRNASCRFVFSSNLKDTRDRILIYDLSEEDRLDFDLEDEQSLRQHTALHSLLPVTTELLCLEVERRKTTTGGRGGTLAVLPITADIQEPSRMS